jgi:hypothetical protein
VLAEEIERTREELAETLDAIADKVSPKRVTARTKKRVADSVKETAEHAKESLQAGAASVKETAGHVKEQVQEKVGGHDDPVPAVLAVPATSAGELADRTDVTVGLEPAGADGPLVAPLGPPYGGRTLDDMGGVQTYGASPVVPKEALAGAAAAIVVLLFMLGRRKRKRASGWKSAVKR